MRLASIELTEKAVRCFGVKMLKAFTDTDLYQSLIKLYGIFPFNDIVMSLITSILSRAIDFTLA